MAYQLLKNCLLVNEGDIKACDILLKDFRIEKIANQIECKFKNTEINCDGNYLLPGIIDDQVHFREPGYEYKATIETESKAALAGGVTSFMEMPNTVPNTTTIGLLKQKWDVAAKTSWVNYSFYLGANLSNLEDIKQAHDFKGDICGLKIFMGSSTGGMLVDNPLILESIFKSTELLITTHCEYEPLIRKNFLDYQNSALSVNMHPLIRNAEVCFQSSLLAVQLAQKTGARLHILHISTEKEIQLFSNLKSLEDKQITAEVCVHHLHFCDEDYDRLGNLIKCNPAIKSAQDRLALWKGLLDDNLDIIATDHAPHTFEEKQQPYLQAPAGLPLVQHGLNLMLYYVAKGHITIEKVVQKMCHNPALLFKIRDRGFVREGHFADLVLIAPQPFVVSKSNLYYKCKWSPLENQTFPYRLQKCWVNGHLSYQDGIFNKSPLVEKLKFN